MNRSVHSVRGKLDRLSHVDTHNYATMVCFHCRWIVAVHEAGHSVASILRGGEGNEITLFGPNGGESRSHRLTENWPFIAYAGLWAEARARWEWDLLHEYDDAEFKDYLAMELDVTTTSSESDLVRAYRRAVLDVGPLVNADVGHRLISRRDALWDNELEKAWPVICQVADRLLVGESINDEYVRELLLADVDTDADAVAWQQ